MSHRSAYARPCPKVEPMQLSALLLLLARCPTIVPAYLHLSSAALQCTVVVVVVVVVVSAPPYAVVSVLTCFECML